MYGSNSTTITNVGWADITGASNDTGYRIIVTSPAGTQVDVTPPPTTFSGKSISEKRIAPALYFKYVKSKLTKTDLEKLKPRLLRLNELTRSAFDLGQQALYEEYAKRIAIIVREQEAAACGYDQWVGIKDIEKFKEITKEDGKKPVYFKKIEEFPRSVPTRQRDIIRQVQAKGIFDQLWILYLDYQGTELKTNKEKIRSKDPICFGQFAYAKDRYFYICDWVDEYCDLTLDKFLDKLDPEYVINKTPDIDQKFIEKIKEEVLARQKRLDGTKRSNYEDYMKEEDLEDFKKKVRAEIEAEKKLWWKFWT